MKLQKKYKTLIYKKVYQSLTSDEEKSLNKWLEAQPENRDCLLQIQKMLNHVEQPKFKPVPPSETMWEAIQQETMRDQTETASPSLLQRFSELFQTKCMAYALASIFVLGIGLSLYYTVFNPYETVVSKKGERRTCLLPDGTSIVLNSDTRIKYNNNYLDGNRCISLKGEAFFDVVHSGSPFDVSTGNSKITVLGTKFNIRCRDEATIVFLKQGKVKVKSNHSDTLSTVLVDSQKCIVDAGKIIKSSEKVNVDAELGWMAGKLVFEKAPLSKVAREIERYYNVKIRIKDPELKKRTITATLYQLTVDEAIDNICKVMHIRYQKKKKRYLLTQ